MRRKIIEISVICILLVTCSFLSIQIYKYSIPKQGKVLAYEEYKGYVVPIIANGNGGKVRFIGNVPWSKFTIEEKFDMARVGGGFLGDTDIQEIARKYGKR